MTQVKVGLAMWVFLMLPPVAELLESIMIIHMHMQMPLFVIAGFLIAPWFQKKCPAVFSKYNRNGIPGIVLFLIIMLYWMVPRTMDEALTLSVMEIFKFVSLPFLAGVPLRDSWTKLGKAAKNMVFIFFLVSFAAMGALYIFSPVQLCNNYLQIEQVTLGWGYITMGAAILVYLAQMLFIDPADYE
ncbi:hypothetical protein JNUCC1_00359 [Lentibacillus sp. JNUCC-1]|nr:hypothetical protein [Lentibacillus sp. JNUCC-1]MUV36556.1 hypothetical protein [Lentibacillus sp. JNUCC-1]